MRRPITYRRLRPIFSVILVFLFLVSCLSAGGKKEVPQEESAIPVEDTIEEAARVNGTIIAVEDVDRQVLRFQQQYQSQGLNLTVEQEGIARRRVLEGLIDRRLMKLSAAGAGYSADPAEVEEQFAQYKGQFSGEEELNAVLAEQGLTLESIRADIGEYLAIQAFLEKEFYENIEITEGAARDFYDGNPGIFDQPEEVRASHIFLALDPQAEEDVRRGVEDRMKAIQERIAGGEEFAALAMELSEGPSGPQGGDLGFFGRGAMVPEFEAAAFALNAEEVSKVVQTPYGLHLIKLMDRREARTPSFEEVKNQIIDTLTDQKAQEAIDSFLAEQRGAAQIEIVMELPPIPDVPGDQ